MSCGRVCPSKVIKTVVPGIEFPSLSFHSNRLASTIGAELTEHSLISSIYISVGTFLIIPKGVTLNLGMWALRLGFILFRFSAILLAPEPDLHKIVVLDGPFFLHSVTSSLKFLCKILPKDNT